MAKEELEQGSVTAVRTRPPHTRLRTRTTRLHSDSERSGSCTETDRRPTRTVKRLSHRQISRLHSADAFPSPIGSSSLTVNGRAVSPPIHSPISASPDSGPYQVRRPRLGTPLQTQGYAPFRINSDERTEGTLQPQPQRGALDSQPLTVDTRCSPSPCKDKAPVQILNPSSPIAYGVYCDIFLGIHSVSRNRLAMKRLRSHTSESRETVDVQRRLQREARIWSSLAHPNTLPFLGLEEISNETYLVSPWMENGDLSKFCVERLRYLALTTHDQSLIPTAQVKAFGRFDEFDITRGIARGLAYLHDRGVIHGDLKAANVLLDDSVNPMLSDFGMSKVMEGTYGRTSPALKGMGSTRWKSPELMDDCPKTMKSDVYALGMTIVEVLTGRMPFHKISSQEKVMLEVTNGSRPPFEPLSRGNRSFAALWSLASSCWVADPDKRPSANEIAAGFATAVTSSDPTDGPTDIAASIISVPNNVAFPLTSNLNSPRDPRWPMKPSPGMADPVRLPSTTNRDQNQPIRVTAPPQNNNGQTFNKVNDDRQRHDAQRRPQSNQSPSDALWKAGDDHRKAGRYDDACAELDAACRAYHREGNWLGAAKCLWSLGRVYRKRGQHKEAYSMLQKACRVYEDFGDLSGMAACLRSLGDVLRGQGLYEKACSTLMEAWRVYQQLGDGLGMADSLKSIAHVHRQQGNYHGAEKVLKVACQAYRKEQDNFAVADCLKDLGDVYRKQRKYEDAQFALQEAFEIQTQLGNARSMEDYPRGTSDAYRVQGPLASRPELPQTQTERRTPGADVLVAGSVDITPDRHSPRHAPIYRSLLQIS